MTDPEVTDRSLAVYVPAPGSELRETIWRGSGIVGSPAGETGRLRLDFEGDDERYPSFAARVRRAAERHLWSDGAGTGYPTRACAYADANEVVPVGTYAPEADLLTVDDPDTLRDWLEDEEVPDLPDR